MDEDEALDEKNYDQELQVRGTDSCSRIRLDGSFSATRRRPEAESAGHCSDVRQYKV